MLIGIDASRANRKFKGGTEWYSYYLIRELAKIDSKNKYILYSDKPLVGGLADLTKEDYEAASGRIDKRGYQTIKSPFGNFRVKILKWPFAYFWTQIRLSYEMLAHRPDILFIPAGGRPFISQEAAIKLIKQIEPKIVVPAFFKLPGLKRQSADLKNFLEELNHKENKEKRDKLTVKKKDLADIKKTEVIPLFV